VLRTRVGYAGGKKEKPTYRSLGDHTEAIQIEFDPKVVTFERLLEVFWGEHDPCSKPWSTQYKAVLWTHGEEQARAARAFVEAWRKEHGGEVTTQITAAPRFWIAEDYHQKYRLRAHPGLVKALLGSEATDEQIRESTVAARVNGWIAGHGTAREIEAECTRLGLSKAARKALREVLGPRGPSLPE
jgi:methionine-S-sulfoxide reductase